MLKRRKSVSNETICFRPMIIANPIYDVVFKRMMENEKVVKFFIGTLLDETIETVEVQPQEFTYTDALAGLAVFRLDFIATIKTATGERKKVLIEIQKARNLIDVMRFRSYLAEQYKKEDTIDSEKVILPITTIYILGFALPEIETPCLRVERNYKDLISGEILHRKSAFIEKLTHDSFVVQVERITDRYQTRLDKLLSVFEQKNFVDSSETTKDFLHTPDSEELRTLTDILHYVGTDPKERKQIEIEKEAWRTVNAMFAEKEQRLLKSLGEKEKALEEKEKALEEKDKALDEKDKVIAELLRKLNEQ